MTTCLLMSGARRLLPLGAVSLLPFGIGGALLGSLRVSESSQLLHFREFTCLLLALLALAVHAVPGPLIFLGVDVLDWCQPMEACLLYSSRIVDRCLVPCVVGFDLLQCYTLSFRYNFWSAPLRWVAGWRMRSVCQP